MRAAIIFCVLVAVAFASDVVTLTDKNFDEVIGSHDFVLVEFYAPWCGHCKKLAPEWEKAATELKGKAVLAALDATAEQAAAGKFSIQGYPTIKIFRDGQASADYDGPRDAAGIVRWVKGNSGPAVNVVADAAGLETLKTENQVLVVLFASAETDSFKKAASALRSTATFAFVSDASLFEGADGSIVVYKQFDDKKNIFEGDASDAIAIQTFVSGASVRLFDEIGPENYKMYVERKLPMGWLFAQPSAADFEETKNKVASIAGDFKGKISLIWIDADKYAQMAGRLGLQGKKFPSFAIDHEGQHFTLENKEFSSDDIKKLITDYLAGDLQPTLKTEDAPAEHTVEGLTTVVGSTFEELVTKADTNVLIEFYAPWCGHCKKLTPIYKEVAAATKDNENVRIAMIDATANDYPQKVFNVQGFPTIYWYPKATKEPVAYEGARDKEGFLKFIEEKTA